MPPTKRGDATLARAAHVSRTFFKPSCLVVRIVYDDPVLTYGVCSPCVVLLLALSGELKGGDWEGPNGAMAKLLLLDQFPRTAYR